MEESAYKIQVIYLFHYFFHQTQPSNIIYIKTPFCLFGNMFSDVSTIIYFVLFPSILKLWTVNNSVTICYIYGNRCCTCWRGMTLKFLVLFEYCMEGKITTFTWIVRSFKRSLNPFKYLQLAGVNRHGNLGSNFMVQNISSINRFSGIGNFLLYIGCW